MGDHMDEGIELDISRQIVADVAPEELEFFDEILLSTDQKQPAGENFLGFGGDAGMVMLTGFLITVGKEIAEFLWDNGKDAAGQFVREASQSARVVLQRKLKEWLDSKAKGKAPVVVSEEALTTLTERVMTAAAHQKLPNENIQKINEWILAKFGEG